jgi:hypothetical protein
MGQGDERRLKILDNLADTSITGWFPPLLPGNGDNLAMNGGKGERRGLQGQTFNQRNRFGWQAARLSFV